MLRQVILEPGFVLAAPSGFPPGQIGGMIGMAALTRRRDPDVVQEAWDVDGDSALRGHRARTQCGAVAFLDRTISGWDF